MATMTLSIQAPLLSPAKHALNRDTGLLTPQKSIRQLLSTKVLFVPGTQASTYHGLSDHNAKAVNEITPPSPATNKPPSATPINASIQPASKSARPTIPLPSAWPKMFSVGPGYHNMGNTCFLNSTLQVLVHTPQLLYALLVESQHSPSNCQWNSRKKPCCLCLMYSHVRKCVAPGRGTAISPRDIVNSLSKICHSMRVGRQEDAHEFLRFFLDGMQQACLAGKGATPSREIRNSTIISRIFGGTLRSRILCENCGHCSDTFDDMMDLSVDIGHHSHLTQILRDFVKVEKLSGQNKYKCEKCKKLVNAKKNFTIEKAPEVLTIHLKRFNHNGRKLNHSISYGSSLQLGPYMSDDTTNPSYKLFGIVCHSGSGVHSGHYVAQVEGGDNQWHCMNDSSSTRISPNSSQVADNKSAYILFYRRSSGSLLNDVINRASQPSPVSNKGSFVPIPYKPASEPSEPNSGPSSPALPSSAPPSSPKSPQAKKPNHAALAKRSLLEGKPPSKPPSLKRKHDFSTPANKSPRLDDPVPANSFVKGKKFQKAYGRMPHLHKSNGRYEGR